MKRPWYSIQNAASEDTPATVVIFDEIGYWGITAADFGREFRAIKANIINLEINSPGGNVFDGIAIYNMLNAAKANGKTINATVMGIAASIASVILMAADKITMPANTMVMVHSPSGGVFGTSDDMREMADVLDKVKDSLVGTYMKRTGKSDEDIRNMLATDTFMSAQEALDNGFADEIIDAIEMTAKFDLADQPANIQAFFKKKDPESDNTPQNKLPNPAPTSAFADSVAELARAAGFEAHAGAWALAFVKIEDVQARIAEAREIQALCKVLGKADQATAYITNLKSLSDVRADLAAKLAEGDKPIDTAPPKNNQPTNKSAGPSDTVAGIWAKRNKQTTGV